MMKAHDDLKFISYQLINSFISWKNQRLNLRITRLYVRLKSTPRKNFSYNKVKGLLSQSNFFFHFIFQFREND